MNKHFKRASHTEKSKANHPFADKRIVKGGGNDGDSCVNSGNRLRKVILTVSMAYKIDPSEVTIEVIDKFTKEKLHNSYAQRMQNAEDKGLTILAID